MATTRHYHDGWRGGKTGNFLIVSERVKNTFGNFFPFTMRTGTGDEAETQEEEEDIDGQVDFGSQVSLNSSTQENDAYTDREAGTMDQFGVVRTISKTTNGSGQSGDFVNMINSETRTGENKTQGFARHRRIDRWIMKGRRGREPKPKSRLAPSYLGSTG